VHQGALTSSTIVNPLNNVPKISAAQGQQLSILGVCHLILQIGDQKTSEHVELLVDDLVVPLLLGTRWIDANVVQIEPRTREVLLQFAALSPRRVPLLESNASTAIRVATPRCYRHSQRLWLRFARNDPDFHCFDLHPNAWDTLKSKMASQTCPSQVAPSSVGWLTFGSTDFSSKRTGTRCG
jgi:hypothetical protein